MSCFMSKTDHVFLATVYIISTTIVVITELWLWIAIFASHGQSHVTLVSAWGAGSLAISLLRCEDWGDDMSRCLQEPCLNPPNRKAPSSRLQLTE